MADKNVVGGGVPDTPEKKRRQEKETVGLMIELYCRGNHGTPKGQLCPDCAALRDYADARVDHCPHMATKTFCRRYGILWRRGNRRRRNKYAQGRGGPCPVLYCRGAPSSGQDLSLQIRWIMGLPP